jgi:hypothetical protein
MSFTNKELHDAFFNEVLKPYRSINGTLACLKAIELFQYLLG